MHGISLSLQHEVKGGRRDLIFPSLLCRNHIKACSNRRTELIQEESTSQTSVSSSFCNQEGTSLFSVYFCFNCGQTGASQKQNKFWEQALLVLHGQQLSELWWIGKSFQTSAPEFFLERYGKKSGFFFNQF